jgi:predicted transcriptional regulator
MHSTDEATVLECTTTIIAAYVANNTIQKETLPALIADTFVALTQAGRQEVPAEALKPAVPIKRSVQPDHIICLEDGKKFKSLKRHLMSHYNMTPQEYREKWGLPADYPMVAPNYALARSELAKQSGLGRRSMPAPIAETAKASVKPAKVARGAKGAAAEKASAVKKGAAKKEAARIPA